MKWSKFSEARCPLILRQADEGATVGEVYRKVGVSEATFYVCFKKCAGLMPLEMKRLKQLEDENGKWIYRPLGRFRRLILPEEVVPLR